MKSWTAPQASPASGLWSSSSTLSVEIGKIKYEQVDSPVKFYHHFLGNLYKAGDVVAYKEFSKDWRWKAFPHTVELDGRLLKRSKDIILKAIHDLLTKLETKDVDANSASAQLAFTSHGGGKSSFRGRSGSGTANPKHWTGRIGGKFCRLCQAARFSRRIFTSHKVQDCSKVCLEKMSWFLTCKLILKSTQWLWLGSGSSMTNRPWNFLFLRFDYTDCLLHWCWIRTCHGSSCRMGRCTSSTYCKLIPG